MLGREAVTTPVRALVQTGEANNLGPTPLAGYPFQGANVWPRVDLRAATSPRSYPSWFSLTSTVSLRALAYDATVDTSPGLPGWLLHGAVPRIPPGSNSGTAASSQVATR